MILPTRQPRPSRGERCHRFSLCGQRHHWCQAFTTTENISVKAGDARVSAAVTHSHGDPCGHRCCPLCGGRHYAAAVAADFSVMTVNINSQCRCCTRAAMACSADIMKTSTVITGGVVAANAGCRRPRVRITTVTADGNDGAAVSATLLLFGSSRSPL